MADVVSYVWVAFPADALLSCCPCDLYVYVIVCRSRRVFVRRMKRVPEPSTTFIGSLSCAPLPTLLAAHRKKTKPLCFSPSLDCQRTHPIPFPFSEPALTMFQLMSLLLVNANWRLRFDNAYRMKYLSLCFIAFLTIICTHIMRSLHSCPPSGLSNSNPIIGLL